MTVETDTLAEIEADKLRKWLAHPSCDIFLLVVGSEIFQLECESAKCLMAATNIGDKTAEARVDEARKLKYIAELFKKYLARDYKFRTARALPSPVDE